MTKVFRLRWDEIYYHIRIPGGCACRVTNKHYGVRYVVLLLEEVLLLDASVLGSNTVTVGRVGRVGTLSGVGPSLSHPLLKRRVPAYNIQKKGC